MVATAGGRGSLIFLGTAGDLDLSEDPDITGEDKYSCSNCLRSFKDEKDYNDGSLEYKKTECPRCGSSNVSKNITLHN